MKTNAPTRGNRSARRTAFVQAHLGPGLPDGDISYYHLAASDAKRAQVVLFDIAQAEVFWRIIEQGGYLPPFDELRLPFEDMWIEFSSPLLTEVGETDNGFTPCDHMALLVSQWGDIHVFLIDSDNDISGSFGFNGDAPNHVEDWASSSISRISRYEDYDKLRSLVCACIGYINCENVYLEKQGEVPESVNRKRIAKGKSRIEPYYVCRIRGVQYNSDGTETGSKHGIRYDVRGHFRRLQSGKTLWVRPHQRGLANELYMPKVYKVDKGSKPQWETT